MKNEILTNSEFEKETGFISDGFYESSNINTKIIYKRKSKKEIERIIFDDIIDIFSLTSVKVKPLLLESCVYKKTLSEAQIKLMNMQLSKNHNIELQN